MYEKGNVSIREEKKIPRMFHSRSHFVLCFMQELMKVACKIRKSYRIKIYGDSLKHCAAGT